VILLIALGLRLWGVTYGKPYRYHPDERGHVVEAARMAAARTLEPRTFAWPPLYAYVLMVEYAAYLGVGLVTGEYGSISQFAEAMESDPFRLFVIGRVTSAICGALTVLVVYQVGKAAYSRRIGLLAAAFLSVAFLHVRDSHYTVSD